MKRTLCLVALLLGVSFADDGKPKLDSLNWLAGSWGGAMWGGDFKAHYSTSAGGKILSYSELLKEGKSVFYEFEKFETKGGEIYLTPYPGGRAAASFRLTSAKDKKATSENPKKDFPTRIVYHRKADDNLVITLSDPHGKSDKVQVFDLKKR